MKHVKGKAYLVDEPASQAKSEMDQQVHFDGSGNMQGSEGQI